MFHAIVSVMAVKIQFSSPNIVRRSVICPGILIKKKLIQKNVSSNLILITNRNTSVSFHILF